MGVIEKGRLQAPKRYEEAVMLLKEEIEDVR
jgi:hypothetical protein